MRKILILGINGFIGHHLSRRILDTTDWDVYGMDMQTDRIADLLPEKRFHFFEGDITINREWIEYHIKKCDTVLPLVAIATPATYVREPLRVFELDFEANLPIVRACVRYGKRIIFPSTSEVYGMSRKAAHGSRHSRVRHATGARLHAVPAVQLDRLGAGLDQYRQGRLVARHHPVSRAYSARRGDQAGRRRNAKAGVHVY